MFSRDHLAEELKLIQASMAPRVGHLTLVNELGGSLDGLLSSFRDEAPVSSISLAQGVSSMWTVFHSHSPSIDAIDIKMCMERRRLMLANAAGWQWLDSYVFPAIQRTLETLASPTEQCLDSHWLVRLVRDVYNATTQKKKRVIAPRDYLPFLPTTTTSFHTLTKVSPATLASKVTSFVVTAIRTWLNFPSNTYMLSGYFVINLLLFVKNPDILLFSSIWKVHMHIKSKLLGIPGHRHSSLTTTLLEPFIDKLKDHPICDSTSEEFSLLSQISATIREHRSSNHSSAFQSLEQFLGITVSQPPDVPVPPRRLRATLPASDSTVVFPSGDIPITPLEGRHHLLNLIRALIPLVSGNLPEQMTPLQSLVWKRMDFFLPFRERAPCRTRLTSSRGPFHADHVDEPGAFPSWVISRALIFGTVALRDYTHGFFPDHPAWLAFLNVNGYSDDPHVQKEFYDLRCYGSCQGGRKKAFHEAHLYFDKEVSWFDLLKNRPKGRPIPFHDFFDWTQDAKTKLPEVGPLTAYLLTADLVYANKVETPTTQDIAYYIHRMGLGSRSGLLATSQIQSKKASAADIRHAFESVYTFLDSELTADEKNLIRFDAIMVEHLLCKYQRIQKNMPKAKKKKN